MTDGAERVTGVCRAGVVLLVIAVAGGCVWPRWFDASAPVPDPRLVLLVAPVTIEAPIERAAEIYTFDDPPSEDIEPHVRTQLLNELALRTQRILIEQLSGRPAFQVIPFADARRLADGARPAGTRWTTEELEALGRVAGADAVVSARIHDYGRLSWRHWVYGWLGVASTHTALVGAATAWNPVAMGGYLAYDLATDLPLWYGGAYVLGWAFRPVHVEADAVQLHPCVKPVWYNQEVTILVDTDVLETYPEAQRARKDVQLQINLERGLATLAEAAGKSLRPLPCEGI